MNIMLIGGGRRVSFAELLIGHNLYSYEASSNQPIASVAKIIVGKKWSDPSFLSHIADEIKSKDINLIIPLMDNALIPCSELKKLCAVPTSEANTNEICFNKVKFGNFMLDNFKEFYPYDDGTYPKIIKPIFGFGSNGIYSIENEQSLNIFPYDTLIHSIIQKKITGKEYSVDAYFDPSSNCIDTVCRSRIRVVGGEVLTSMTENNDELRDITRKIGGKLKLIGPTCFQYIVSDRAYILEVNARFGGGSTLSVKSGFNMIKLIMRDYFNIPYDYKPDSWKRNLLMERCMRDYFYEK
jgi:carbamoyl-phosphate synthase large subunit